MRAVVQRVEQAAVTVDGATVAAVGRGLLVYLGVERGDTAADVRRLAEKVAALRLFPDGEGGRFDRSVREVGGEVLVVSQFTLCGDCRRGRRPNFGGAAPPQEAAASYEDFTAQLARHGVPVATGRFRAHMRVESVNDGPVTLLLDSKRLF